MKSPLTAPFCCKPTLRTGGDLQKKWSRNTPTMELRGKAGETGFDTKKSMEKSTLLDCEPRKKHLSATVHGRYTYTSPMDPMGMV